MEKYKWLREIGHGSFSYVYLAQNTQTGAYVAIKAMKHQLTGQDQYTQLREIRALEKCKHPNIIKLLESFIQNNKLYLIFECMDDNLYDHFLNNPTYHCLKKHQQQMHDHYQTPKQDPTKNTRNKAKSKESRQRSTRQRENEEEISDNIPEKTIKEILAQICLGLSEMHAQNILHRDLKPENILMRFSNTNFKSTEEKLSAQIKIADFGLARQPPSSSSLLTSYISTRWYRAPQLVVRMKKYTQAVDIFALGCIMAELYNNKPLFPAQNTVHHLELQINQLGAPGDLEWPEFYGWCIKKGIQIPKSQSKPSNLIKRDSQSIDPHAEDLLKKLLEFNPQKRIPTAKLLEHPYFKTGVQNISELKQKNEKKSDLRIHSSLSLVKDGRCLKTELSSRNLWFLKRSTKKNDKEEDSERIGQRNSMKFQKQAQPNQQNRKNSIGTEQKTRRRLPRIERPSQLQTNTKNTNSIPSIKPEQPQKNTQEVQNEYYDQANKNQKKKKQLKIRLKYMRSDKALNKRHKPQPCEYLDKASSPSYSREALRLERNRPINICTHTVEVIDEEGHQNFKHQYLGKTENMKQKETSRLGLSNKFRPHHRPIINELKYESYAPNEEKVANIFNKYSPAAPYRMKSLSNKSNRSNSKETQKSSNSRLRLSPYRKMFSSLTRSVSDTNRVKTHTTNKIKQYLKEYHSKKKVPERESEQKYSIKIRQNNKQCIERSNKQYIERSQQKVQRRSHKNKAQTIADRMAQRRKQYKMQKYQQSPYLM